MWFPLWKAKFLQLFETLVILWGKARRSQILLFGVDSDCFALDWQEKSTLKNSTEKHWGGGDHMAHLVITLQYEISATIQKSSDLISQGQRLVNPSVCSRFRSFGTRFARDYPHLKIQPNSKGGTTWAMWYPLCKTMFLKLFETSQIFPAKARGFQIF